MDITAYSCYILFNPDNDRTYNGSTKDLGRRLRQHRGIIAGGAMYTTRLHPNPQWTYLCIVTCRYPFDIEFTEHLALSLEHSIAHPNGLKKPLGKYEGANGRLTGLLKAMKKKTFQDLLFTVYVHHQFINDWRTMSKNKWEVRAIEELNVWD